MGEIISTVRNHTTEFKSSEAPNSTDLSAAWQMVPQVSAMSSTRMATRSLTSPTRTMRSTSLAFFLSLWMRANSTFRRSAMDVTLDGEKRRSRQTWTQTFSDHSNRRVSSPFGSACIRRHDDAVFPLWDIFFDPLKNGRLCVKIVYSNVEKALRGKNRQLSFFKVPS